MRRDSRSDYTAAVSLETPLRMANGGCYLLRFELRAIVLQLGLQLLPTQI